MTLMEYLRTDEGIEGIPEKMEMKKLKEPFPHYNYDEFKMGLMLIRNL